MKLLTFEEAMKEDYISRGYLPVKEALGFERGVEPKKSMNTGIIADIRQNLHPQPRSPPRLRYPCSAY